LNLYRNFLSVGALTLLSRIVGFVRDALMAAVLGTGPAADAFFAAFRFPNLFRRLFAEGAFNTAFVPMFAGALEERGEDGARELASRILAWLMLFLVITTVLAEIYMEALLVPFVPGFLSDPAKYELTVFLTRLLFPYLACMSLMAAYAAILNSLGKFFAAAFAPVLLNLVSIAALVPLVTFAVQAPESAAFWVAIATLLGGVVQLWLVQAALKRTGMVPKFRLPRFDADVRRFWVLAVPAILAGGITQINIFVGTIIASGAASAISYIYYADRLYQLPLGIIGIAIGTVLLPELSRHLRGNRREEADRTQLQSLLIAMLLSMPAAAALAALAEPIVRVLFERGAFGPVATRESALTLIGFAVGLPAFVLIRVLQPGFFAREDTLTPTGFAGVSVVINIAVSLILFPSLAHIGIALATSISAWANAFLLGYALFRRGHLVLPRSEWLKHAGIVGVSLVMAGALALLAARAGAIFSPGAALQTQVAALSALVTFGMATYFTLVHITRIQPLGELFRHLRRKRAKPAEPTPSPDAQ